MYVKPVLKWVGGKTQIIDTIMEAFPRTMCNYREPFVGGGSVLLAFLSMVRDGSVECSGNVFASDVNPRLISMYKNIQQNPDQVIACLQGLVEVFNGIDGTTINRKPKTLEEAMTSQESYYYWTRGVYNALDAEECETAQATAYLIFLNKTCFRGVYREGPNGFNVPFGHYKKPGIYDAVHIRTVSELVQGVTFVCQSFEGSLEGVGLGDFIYMDPPYAPENSTSFVGYTAQGFSEEFHTKLFTMCHNIVEQKYASFIMSNADVEIVRNNFPDDIYRVQVVECKRHINSKKPDAKTNEVIIKWVLDS
jgi:DNA adenine methylase